VVVLDNDCPFVPGARQIHRDLKPNDTEPWPSTMIERSRTTRSAFVVEREEHLVPLLLVKGQEKSLRGMKTWDVAV